MGAGSPLIWDFSYPRLPYPLRLGRISEHIVCEVPAWSEPRSGPKIRKDDVCNELLTMKVILYDTNGASPYRG